MDQDSDRRATVLPTIPKRVRAPARTSDVTATSSEELTPRPPAVAEEMEAFEAATPPWFTSMSIASRIACDMAGKIASRLIGTGTAGSAGVGRRRGEYRAGAEPRVVDPGPTRTSRSCRLFPRKLRPIFLHRSEGTAGGIG
jgi:hypothetical protein